MCNFVAWLDQMNWVPILYAEQQVGDNKANFGDPATILNGSSGHSPRRTPVLLVYSKELEVIENGRDGKP